MTTATIAVFHAATPLGRDLSRGLADAGARLALLGDDAVVGLAASIRDDGGTAVGSVHALDAREDFDAGLHAAEAALGRIDVVVVPVFGRTTATPRPLLESTEDDWIEACERPLRECRYAVQAAFGAFTGERGDGGRVVLVAPSSALSGEAGRVGAAVAAEGARSMARVVAKGWGRYGIVLHWVGVPTGLFTDDGAATSTLAVWDAALGRAPSVRDDVASVVAMLASPEAAFLTATTNVVDGGYLVPL